MCECLSWDEPCLRSLRAITIHSPIRPTHVSGIFLKDCNFILRFSSRLSVNELLEDFFSETKNGEIPLCFVVTVTPELFEVHCLATSLLAASSSPPVCSWTLLRPLACPRRPRPPRCGALRRSCPAPRCASVCACTRCRPTTPSWSRRLFQEAHPGATGRRGSRSYIR